MKNNSNTAEQTVKSSNRLLDDLHDNVAKAKAMLKRTADNVSGESVASLRERCERSQAQLGHLFSDTKKQCVDSARRVDAGVRANPYRSLAIVAGVALLIGLLARRKRPILQPE